MSDQTLTLLSPAKLNLFLHILGRRDDGYHELQSLFQLLDYGDVLEINPEDSELLSLHITAESPIKSISMDDNLILKAAQLLRKASGKPNLGASISITKRIPIGAGLSPIIDKYTGQPCSVSKIPDIDRNLLQYPVPGVP